MQTKNIIYNVHTNITQTYISQCPQTFSQCKHLAVVNIILYNVNMYFVHNAHTNITQTYKSQCAQCKQFGCAHCENIFLVTASHSFILKNECQECSSKL